MTKLSKQIHIYIQATYNIVLPRFPEIRRILTCSINDLASVLWTQIVEQQQLLQPDVRINDINNYHRDCEVIIKSVDTGNEEDFRSSSKKLRSFSSSPTQNKLLTRPYQTYRRRWDWVMESTLHPDLQKDLQHRTVSHSSNFTIKVHLAPTHQQVGSLSERICKTDKQDEELITHIPTTKKTKERTVDTTIINENNAATGIDTDAVPSRNNPLDYVLKRDFFFGNALLTGVTGFLGAHLLRDLIVVMHNSSFIEVKENIENRNHYNTRGICSVSNKNVSDNGGNGNERKFKNEERNCRRVVSTAFYKNYSHSSAVKKGFDCVICDNKQVFMPPQGTAPVTNNSHSTSSKRFNFTNKIFCLVRVSNEAVNANGSQIDVHAMERIEKAMRYYELDKQLEQQYGILNWQRFVVAVAGDLTEPKLGQDGATC